MNNNLLKNMGSWERLFFLCFFAFVGYIVSILCISIASQLLAKGLSPSQMMQSATFVRVSQAIVGMGVFLIPSLVFIYLFESKKVYSLRNLRFASPMGLVLIILLVIIVQPFVESIGELNKQIALPDSFISVENWMKEKETSAQSIVDLCFENKGISSFICNLLIIAVLAGVAEELFFRRCMQRTFEKIVLNSHMAIWLTAFIFSAVHLQFYGFFPRLLLGAMLGYLFVWSRNIWVPILVHILNNAVVVILMQMDFAISPYETIRDSGGGAYIGISVSSFVGTLIILRIIYKRYNKKHMIYKNIRAEL